SFERHTQEILNTNTGVVFFWILTVPFINAIYDMADTLCLDFGTTEELRRVVRFIAGISAIVFCYRWMKKMKKGGR
ncbi:MAG: hypothetical protein ACQUHE_06615, partial [Bacteroidia bacterium]